MWYFKLKNKHFSKKKIALYSFCFTLLQKKNREQNCNFKFKQNLLFYSTLKEKISTFYLAIELIIIIIFYLFLACFYNLQSLDEN